MPAALFIRHRAKPGLRDEIMRIWEKHVQPRVSNNPDHLAYYFCFDDKDADVVSVFQIYRTETARDSFMTPDWGEPYLSEIAEVTADSPELRSASIQWSKQG